MFHQTNTLTTGTDAVEKRGIVAKMMKAWEAKATKRAANATGFTLMAVSLAACNDDAATPSTSAADLAAAAKKALTDVNNVNYSTVDAAIISNDVAIAADAISGAVTAVDETATTVQDVADNAALSEAQDIVDTVNDLLGTEFTTETPGSVLIAALAESDNEGVIAQALLDDFATTIAAVNDALGTSLTVDSTLEEIIAAAAESDNDVVFDAGYDGSAQDLVNTVNELLGTEFTVDTPGADLIAAIAASDNEAEILAALQELVPAAETVQDVFDEGAASRDDEVATLTGDLELAVDEIEARDGTIDTLTGERDTVQGELDALEADLEPLTGAVLTADTDLVLIARGASLDGTSTTLGVNDTIIGLGDNTLDLTLTAINATASVRGVETINVVWNAFGTALFDASNVDGAEIVLTASKVGFLGSATITATGANNITAGSGMTGTLTANGVTTGTIDGANATIMVVVSAATTATTDIVTVTAGANTTNVTVQGFNGMTVDAKGATTIQLDDDAIAADDSETATLIYAGTAVSLTNNVDDLTIKGTTANSVLTIDEIDAFWW